MVSALNVKVFRNKPTVSFPNFTETRAFSPGHARILVCSRAKFLQFLTRIGNSAHFRDTHCNSSS
jgi:hypothetical protein